MKTHVELDGLEVNYQLLHTRGMDMLPVRHYLQQEFGRENYNLFRRIGIKRALGEDVKISPEARQAVDERMYDRTGRRFGVDWGRGLWLGSLARANETIDCARGILFPDHERVASLTVNVAWSTNRPSAVLERITKQTHLEGATRLSALISEECKAEQFRQLALAVPCAEEMLVDSQDAKEELTAVNDFLEEEFFVGRSGEVKPFHKFSYHERDTNKLVGLSDKYPDPRFPEGLWVKSLPYKVREIGIRDAAGKVIVAVPALYDQREKPFGKRVIKGLYKSKKDIQSNGKIEVARHVEDPVGFKLVVMKGGRPMRDRVAKILRPKLEEIFGVSNVKSDDSVNPDAGRLDRFPCRRWKAYKEYYEGARPKLEVIIQSLGDYINSEFHIGMFNPKTGMYDGTGHPLHDLLYVVEIAPDLWSAPIFDIDIPKAATIASYEYAGRMVRAQRIDLSSYEDY